MFALCSTAEAGDSLRKTSPSRSVRRVFDSRVVGGAGERSAHPERLEHVKDFGAPAVFRAVCLRFAICRKIRRHERPWNESKVESDGWARCLRGAPCAHLCRQAVHEGRPPTGAPHRRLATATNEWRSRYPTTVLLSGQARQPGNRKVHQPRRASLGLSPHGP